jgi:hypothetical protein
MDLPGESIALVGYNLVTFAKRSSAAKGQGRRLGKLHLHGDLLSTFPLRGIDARPDVDDCPGKPKVKGESKGSTFLRVTVKLS